MAGIFPPDFVLNVSDRSLVFILEEYHFPRNKKPANNFETDVRNKIRNDIQIFMTDVVSILKERNKFDVGKIKWYYMVWREGKELTIAAYRGFPNLPVSTATVEEFINLCTNSTDEDLIERVRGDRTLFAHMCSLVASYLLLQSQIERFNGVYKEVNAEDWFEKLNDYQSSRKQTDIEKAWISAKERIGTVMSLKL